MAEPESPLGSVIRPGRHGNMEVTEPGVTLTETCPGSIVQVAAWPNTEAAVMSAIRTATSLVLPDGAGGGVVEESRAAFGFAPGRFLVIDQAEGAINRLSALVGPEIGTVLDLSHGRTALRISGNRVEWVLSKLFAIDFALVAFPLGAGRSTVHHDIFAQIQRTAPDAFDIYVFRSFARSFWGTLSRAADEVGYLVK